MSSAGSAGTDVDEVFEVVATGTGGARGGGVVGFLLLAEVAVGTVYGMMGGDGSGGGDEDVDVPERDGASSSALPKPL